MLPFTARRKFEGGVLAPRYSSPLRLGQLVGSGRDGYVVVNQPRNLLLLRPQLLRLLPCFADHIDRDGGRRVTRHLQHRLRPGSLSGTNNSQLTSRGGTIVIAANQAGNTNYSAATR